jgi:hypothetical protein
MRREEKRREEMRTGKRKTRDDGNMEHGTW